VNDSGVSVDAALLESLVSDGLENVRQRRFAQFAFVRTYLVNQRRLASVRSMRGVTWHEVEPEDVEEDGLYVALDLARQPRNIRFHLTDPGAENTRNSYGTIDDGDTGAVLVDRLPAHDTVDLLPDTGIIDRQLKAEQKWRERPHPDRLAFYRIFEAARFAAWPPVGGHPLLEWTFLSDGSREGAEEQRQFVGKALASPDFAVLDGPPGSGKTTVICEIVSQVVRAGGRVLLCGQTHEAVDNVLERLTDQSSSVRDEVMPLRLGRDRNRMSPLARRFSMEDLASTVRDLVRRDLSAEGDRTIAQDRMISALDSERSEIDSIIINSANVLCGTTMGVVGSPQLRQAFDAAEPVFDVLIVDEASKLTLAEFLVPALLAKKWILSGDPMQLPPYSDESVVENLLRMIFGLEPTDGDAADRGQGLEPQLAELALVIVKRFQLRFNRGDPQYASTTSSVAAHVAAIAEGADAEKVSSMVREIDNLLLRSVLENLISPRPPHEGINSPEYAAAIDTGIPQPHLAARTTLLSIQQRMHPEISELVRGAVYGGRAMRDPDEMGIRRSWSYDRYPSRAVFVGVRAEPDRDRLGALREAEAEASAREVAEFISWADAAENRDREHSVSLISFYRDGVKALNRAMRSLLGKDFQYGNGIAGRSGHVRIRVGTVDTFQGREADLVVLNIGNDHLTAHLKSLNRVNVALTRARYQLVLVGDHRAMARGGDGILLADLARSLPRFEVLNG